MSKKTPSIIARELAREVSRRSLIRWTVASTVAMGLRPWRAFEILEKAGHKLVFYDATLIFEKDLTGQFDHILVVHVDHETQLKRLMSRDKLSREAAEKIIDAQLPLEKKMAAADLLVDNNQSTEETKKQVGEILKQLSSMKIV